MCAPGRLSTKLGQTANTSILARPRLILETKLIQSRRLLQAFRAVVHIENSANYLKIHRYLHQIAYPKTYWTTFCKPQCLTPPPRHLQIGSAPGIFVVFEALQSAHFAITNCIGSLFWGHPVQSNPKYLQNSFHESRTFVCNFLFPPKLATILEIWKPYCFAK